MSLYQCEECGCMENTACAMYWSRSVDHGGDGRKLCSHCDPRIGEWHGQFSRVFLPKGMFYTNAKGNLAHKETLEEDFMTYAIEQEPDK